MSKTERTIYQAPYSFVQQFQDALEKNNILFKNQIDIFSQKANKVISLTELNNTCERIIIRIKGGNPNTEGEKNYLESYGYNAMNEKNYYGALLAFRLLYITEKIEGKTPTKNLEEKIKVAYKMDKENVEKRQPFSEEHLILENYISFINHKLFHQKTNPQKNEERRFAVQLAFLQMHQIEHESTCPTAYRSISFEKLFKSQHPSEDSKFMAICHKASSLATLFPDKKDVCCTFLDEMASKLSSKEYKTVIAKTIEEIKHPVLQVSNRNER